jgi:transcription antitermination factor NusG
MKTLTIVIEGGLSDKIRDHKDPLARQAKVLVSERVKSVNAKLKKFEVFDGVIFINVDTSEAAEAVVKQFSTIKGAVASLVEPLEAIFRKAQLKPSVKSEAKVV